MTTMTPDQPAWFARCLASYAAGETVCFILHGDLSGYVYSPRVALYGTLRRFLLIALSQLAGGRVVIQYDRARGVTFPFDEEVAQTLRRRQQAGETLAPTDRERVDAHRKQALALLEPAGGRAPATTSATASLVRAAVAGAGPATTPADRFAETRAPGAALTLLNDLLRQPAARGRLAVVLDYADFLCPPADKAMLGPEDRAILAMLRVWGQDGVLAAQDNPLFLLAERLDDLHAEVRSSRSGWKPCYVPLPTREDRLAYLRWRAATNEEPLPFVDLTEDHMASLTAGLNLRHLEDLCLLSAQSGGMTRALLKRWKDEVIAAEFGGIAEMLDPLEGGFAAVGGMDTLVQLAREEIIAPIAAGRLRDVPKGICLVGPPGTGKTWYCRALAAELGFNAVSLRASKILGSRVGDSERNLAAFFEFVQALAPTMVFFDEIDQSDMAQRGNDSGNPVAKNLFSNLLQFLSDESLRGKVIVFLASNRPDLLDSALLRSGRMDLIVPVLLPDAAARRQILAVQIRTLGLAVPDSVIAELVEAATNYSAADLAAVLRKAAQLARRRAEATITAETASDALRFIRVATPLTAEYYTKLAIRACNDAEFLPPDYRAAFADPQSLDARLQELQGELGTDLPAGRAKRAV
jgi:transitional endoplasmic reticulum ATPase